MANKYSKKAKYPNKGKTGMKAPVKRKPIDNMADNTRCNDKYDGSTVTTNKYNDVSWYAKNDQMLRDSASFSYNRPLGGEIKLTGTVVQPYKADTTNGAASTSIPGLMTLVTAMTPGLSTDYTSPINLAAQNQYSFVRYKNSGGTNYEPADMMFYNMSMDSAYALWNFGKRAYGILGSFSQKNWYMPKQLLEGMGLDFDDFKNNISDFRLYLNTSAARLQSFCVPANMPIFIRHSWMFSNIWKDSDNDKAQMYMFVPMYFYKYNEKSSGGGSLTAVQWLDYTRNTTDPLIVNQFVPKLKTFKEFREYMDNILNALSRSEDIGVMSGDILKAYGESGLFTLSPIPEDYSVVPTYNEEVLNQIHNATIMYETWRDIKDGQWDVTQQVNSQTILFNPELAGEPVDMNGAIINMPWNDVTPANTMVGTRLTVCFNNEEVERDGQTIRIGHFTALGTEVILHAFISFHNYTHKTVETEWYGLKSVERYIVEPMSLPVGSGPFTYQQLAQYVNEQTEAAAKRGHSNITIRALASQFDWCPIIYYYARWTYLNPATPGETITNDRFMGPVQGDMDNYTIIKGEDLAQMHLTAIMSEFNIPNEGHF